MKTEEFSLDPFDRKILAELQAAPEISISALAERIGLSQTPCWRRLKALEQQGYIAGRAVLLDARRLGLVVDVFAHVRLSHHDGDTLDTFEAAVSGHPEVVACYSMSGESDYLVRILCRSIEAYDAFLKQKLLRLPGVTAVNSSFSLKTVKQTTELPIDPE
ncbi:Lrp/AsnC family transcriptional regulator [Sphingobium lignivorans]|uniref:Lrp/AsnC family transcriptional regulator n=1 Tax=Sphingobium lignivorans TaxID=2735886 RepID=A0ABR6NCF6_9SPHN|nr:Lrp/AsnC family transcriptional regulator [Sphingobium lignivorans]MBB5984964.1 Lrp/AsnC family transcriptional regulator [Sphingobium lignivorans]